MTVNINYQQYIEPLVTDLQDLVRVPSVRDFSTASAANPYGEAVGQALALMGDKAARDQFTVKEVDGQAIIIEPTENGSQKRIDFISHLDVVGIGPNWTYEPFAATIDNGKMYGRGTSDMKRNALLTYYALKIIADYQIPLKNHLRVVLGADEENEMDDMRYYVQKEGAPDFAFTPDATFPVTLGEKGAITFEISGKLPATSCIKHIQGGEADNVVPSSVTLTFEAANAELIAAYSRDKQLPIEILPAEGEGLVTIKVHGKGAHASTPEIGENAITRALKMVAELCHDEFATLLSDLFHPYDGSGLGVATATEIMGALTNNLGVINSTSAGDLVFTVDFRFPNAITGPEIEQAVMAKLPGFTSARIFDTPAVLQDVNRPAMQILAQTFARHFPDHSQEPIVSGGVTYSKVVPNCVSFGANFETDPHVAHQADEFIALDTLPELLKLYTEVIIALGQAEEL